MMQRIIDLTQMIEENMPVYPGTEMVKLRQIKYLKTDNHNNHKLETSMHVGTHIDGPMHMTESKKYISDFPIDSFIGNGCVIDVRNKNVIEMKAEYEEIIPQGSIVLLYTGFDKQYGSEEYYTEHPLVSEEFANLLVKKHVKILGMDMASPDRMPFDIHKILLGNGVLIIENLTNVNELVNIGEFEVMAFPLKLKADGSMLRVVARSISRA